MDSINYMRFIGNRDDEMPVTNQAIQMDRTGMFLCRKGRARVRLDDKEYVLESGALVLYFPFTLLYVMERSEDLDGVAMTVDLESVQPLLVKLTSTDSLLTIRSNPLTVLDEKPLQEFVDYIRLYLHHLERAKEYDKTDNRRLWQLNNLQLERVKECMLLQIVMAFTNDASRMKNSVDRKDEIVQRFLLSLRTNYRKEHEVSFYSNEMCLTMRYFSSVVKMQTGRTPSHWIMASLLTDAKEQLTSTDKSVKEVSEYLHFPSQSYFGKWFKTQMKMSPLEYKRRVNEN